MRNRSPLSVQLPRFAAYGPAVGLGAYAKPSTIRALKRYRSGLGDTTVQGQIVSKGVSLAVGGALTSAAATGAITAGLTAVGGAALGAAAGSVVPVIGTIIGAAVGFLTSKLFGKADYATVYANANNVQQLFEAYEAVAGEYPGRVYGWPEIQYIFHGAMIWGLFTGNGPVNPGTCTQAMIATKINACGTGQWIDDWIGAGAPNPGSGSNNIVNLVGTALSHGVTDPRAIAAQYLVPGAETISLGKNNGWISVAHSRNPQLYTQMLIDIADVIVSTKYPNTPIYYGAIPSSYSGPVNAPPAQSAPVTQSPVTTSNTAPLGTPSAQAPAPPPAPSPAGSQLKVGTVGSLTTAQGSWTFGNATAAPGSQVLLSGSNTGGYGIILSITASGQVQLTDAANNLYQWSGSGWTTLSTPAPMVAAVNPASLPQLSAAGTTITPGSANSIVSSAGTWTFGTSSDGTGNYQILLNGSAANAGNSNATQLQVNTSGVVVATVSNGSTYGWTAGGWQSLSGPVTNIAVSTPATISANGATIIPGGGSQLITAQGEWTFSSSNDGTGNYYLLLNGSLAGSETGVQLQMLNGIPTLLRNDGSTWGWSGTGWSQLTPATTTASPDSTIGAPSLTPTSPFDDSASYDGGPYPDSYGSSAYSSGYTDTSPVAANPVVPVATATSMSKTEKILLYGGGAAALLAITMGLLHHRKAGAR